MAEWGVSMAGLGRSRAGLRGSRVEFVWPMAGLQDLGLS
jgi:hypothetical protein